MLLRVTMFMFFTIITTNFIRFGRLRTLWVHAELAATKPKLKKRMGAEEKTNRPKLATTRKTAAIIKQSTTPNLFNSYKQQG